MQILNKKITKSEIEKLAQESFNGMIKFVVDIERGILAIDADMHSDLEQLLLEKGSKQENLWGGNYYPGENIIEYESLINIRPLQNNRSIRLENAEIKKKIENIVKKFLS
ncbi:MAG: DUF5674 family protein [Patescibacteria group bacterium]